MNKLIKIFLGFLILLMVSSCGKDFFQKVDTRKTPIKGSERAKKNIEEATTLVQSGNQYMGEVYNTLNHTLRNITSQSINLEISKGNIEDTDFALETTKLAKHQIAEQAGIAIAAQANASATIVLQLIN